MRAWCRKTLGVTPGDLPLYRQALRHVSAVSEERPDLPDNERLEFLGDAVLDAIIGDLLFATYPDKGEGFLTRMRSKLVSRTQLNMLARRIEIERHRMNQPGRRRIHHLAIGHSRHRRRRVRVRAESERCGQARRSGGRLRQDRRRGAGRLSHIGAPARCRRACANQTGRRGEGL